MQSVLDVHFCKVNANIDINNLPSLVHDDVLVFRHIASSDLIHSGRVRFAGQTPYLLSKLGEHPAATLPLATVAQEYAGQFDSIDHYRLAENTL